MNVTTTGYLRRIMLLLASGVILHHWGFSATEQMFLSIGFFLPSPPSFQISHVIAILLTYYMS